jgi:hypothetical protein
VLVDHRAAEADDLAPLAELDDALRLSAAMTAKCALAGLPNGGGKTVVALPPGGTLDAAARVPVLHDAADVIESLVTVASYNVDSGESRKSGESPARDARV